MGCSNSIEETQHDKKNDGQETSKKLNKSEEENESDESKDKKDNHPKTKKHASHNLKPIIKSNIGNNSNSPIIFKNGIEGNNQTPNIIKPNDEKSRRYSHSKGQKDSITKKKNRKSEIINNNLNLNNENIDEVMENLNSEYEDHEENKKKRRGSKRHSKVKEGADNIPEIDEVSVNSSELSSSIQENKEQ